MSNLVRPEGFHFLGDICRLIWGEKYTLLMASVLFCFILSVLDALRRIIVVYRVSHVAFVLHYAPSLQQIYSAHIQNLSLDMPKEGNHVVVVCVPTRVVPQGHRRTPSFAARHQDVDGERRL